MICWGINIELLFVNSSLHRGAPWQPLSELHCNSKTFPSNLPFLSPFQGVSLALWTERSPADVCSLCTLSFMAFPLIKSLKTFGVCCTKDADVRQTLHSLQKIMLLGKGIERWYPPLLPLHQTISFGETEGVMLYKASSLRKFFFSFYLSFLRRELM